jgi:hypothetical protein
MTRTLRKEYKNKENHFIKGKFVPVLKHSSTKPLTYVGGMEVYIHHS